MESTEFGNESVGVRGRDQQFGDYMTCFRREQKNLTDKLLRFRAPDRIVGHTFWHRKMCSDGFADDVRYEETIFWARDQKFGFE